MFDRISCCIIDAINNLFEYLLTKDRFENLPKLYMYHYMNYLDGILSFIRCVAECRNR